MGGRPRWDFLNIGLSLPITSKDILLDLILTTAFSLMVGIMVFLIFALDHPLWGEVSVRPDAFEYAKANMIRLAAKDPRPSPASPGPMPRHVEPGGAPASPAGSGR